MTMPPRELCDRARRTKDARFDGLFFIGVRSTRIFCRPVCPAPSAKPHNIVYFPTPAAAVSAGYRPCLRCRPELSPGTRPEDETVRRALALIAEGWLDGGSVESLASQVGVSARHLRRLFDAKLGSTPLALHQSRRILLAKQLLTETTMSVTQVALAAGFASLRRFNDAFKSHCGVVPSELRRRARGVDGEDLRLRLAYRPPFDFEYLLATLRCRVIAGVERVTANGYERNVSGGGRAAWIRVTADSTKPELLLQAFGVQPACIQSLVRQARRMFDLDADLLAAQAVLVRDPVLAPSIARHPGRRIAGAWEGFEAAVALIVDAAAGGDGAPLRQLIDAFGTRVQGNPIGLDRAFPAADRLAVAELEPVIGLSAHDACGIRRLALAVSDGRLRFGCGQRLDDFVEQLVACTALPVWVAHEIALRALGDPDAWPVADGRRHRRTAGVAATDHASAWRPWRAYALLHIEGRVPFMSRQLPDPREQPQATA